MTGTSSHFYSIVEEVGGVNHVLVRGEYQADGAVLGAPAAR
jgi:hypothetical protein